MKKTVGLILTLLTTVMIFAACETDKGTNSVHSSSPVSSKLASSVASDVASEHASSIKESSENASKNASEDEEESVLSGEEASSKLAS